MLYRRAATDVAAIVPGGIGRRDHAGCDITAAGEAQFVLALKTWVANGTREDRARVGAAYDAFVECCRSAAGQFPPHRAGCIEAPIAIIKADGGGQDFRIPAEVGKAGLRLNPARIASITEDTRALAGVLKEVFDRKDDPVPQARSPTADRGAGPLGLDQPHSELLALLTRQPRWTAAELDQAAKDVGLLGSGAAELINQASFDACGEPLLEGREPIEINDYALNLMEVR
jgi:hypothetical protein